eukprot:TRINITY_DN44491_c0_g1_i1.p1 TRINITY_DN44491_c0_g1~~TRINITY_DN44491_c0_g1_i1.p1  ORF type:complete len:221 (+),score=31.02 TRINITY_DN44491_c0_g1_i1:54-665(+)
MASVAPKTGGPLFLLGRWRGVGKVYSTSERLKPVVHYLEELEVSQQGKAQHYWFHHQTWKYDPEDKDRKKMVPLHVESGCVKLLPPASPQSPAEEAARCELLFGKGCTDTTRVEGTFIHPFSVTEVSTGLLDDANTCLSMSATADKGSFVRGPAAGGKLTKQLVRVWTLTGEGKVVFKAGLQSESMPEVWEHLECELESVPGA